MRLTVEHDKMPKLTLHSAPDRKTSADPEELMAFASAASADYDQAAEVIEIMQEAVRKLQNLLGDG